MARHTSDALDPGGRQPGRSMKRRTLLALVGVSALLLWVWHGDFKSGVTDWLRVIGGPDGEGHAQIESAKAFTAGQKTQFAIRFTVGPSGIPVGGGIAIGMHHASEWDAQIHAPDARGYVTLAGPNAANFTLERLVEVPRGMFANEDPALFSNTIFHRLLVAKVIGSPLQPGDVIDFIFGDNAQGIYPPRYVDADHEFRITMDGNADGRYQAIERSPVFAILPDKPHSLSATASSQALVNESFDVLVRLEDPFYNVVEAYTGTITIRDEHGAVVAADVPILGGLGHARVTLTSVGAHRLRLESDDAQYRGRSNPIRVFDVLPPWRLYWADLHGHTGVSDGLGANADEYFTYGRDVAGLDIIALTDHGHFDWPANIEAVKQFYQPGRYVTLLAQEAGAGKDHMNLYFSRDDADHISKWHDDYSEYVDWVYRQYNLASPEMMTAPHHFSYDRGANGHPLYPFGLWNPKTMRFVEVYSSHGTSEFIGNPRPVEGASTDPGKYMQTALAQGLKFGVIGASDNHDSKPGRSIWGNYPAGLSGVWVKSLDREQVWNALWNYRVYATSIDRIYLEFTVNGEMVGSSIDAAQGAVAITAFVIGEEDSLRVELIRDNDVIQTYTTTNGVVDVSLQDTPTPGTHFYYLRVIQDNGERAWSTPVWLDQR